MRSRREAIYPPPPKANAWSAVPAPEAAARRQATEGLQSIARAVANLYRAGMHHEADEAARLQLEMARLFERVGA